MTKPKPAPKFGDKIRNHYVDETSRLRETFFIKVTGSKMYKFIETTDMEGKFFKFYYDDYRSGNIEVCGNYFKKE